MNLRKDHYRIDRVVRSCLSARRRPVTTRVARWGAPVVERTLYPNGRGLRCRAPKGRDGGRQSMSRTVFAVTLYRCRRPGYLSRPLVVRSSVLCGRPRLCGGAAARRPRTGRARADGERRRSPRVSAGVVRRRPCEVQRVARARLDRPSSGWRASCFGGATSGRPGVVFQFTFLTRVCTVTFVCDGERASRPIVARVDVDSVCDKPIDTLGGGSLGSCVDEERSQLR